MRLCPDTDAIYYDASVDKALALLVFSTGPDVIDHLAETYALSSRQHVYDLRRCVFVKYNSRIMRKVKEVEATQDLAARNAKCQKGGRSRIAYRQGRAAIKLQAKVDRESVKRSRHCLD